MLFNLCLPKTLTIEIKIYLDVVLSDLKKNFGHNSVSVPRGVLSFCTLRRWALSLAQHKVYVRWAGAVSASFRAKMGVLYVISARFVGGSSPTPLVCLNPKFALTPQKKNCQK